MKKFCFLMIAALALGITGSGCGKEDMPEDALKDIQVAIAKQDKELLATRVDVDKFLDMTYDDVTEAIANIPTFGIRLNLSELIMIRIAIFI